MILGNTNKNEQEFLNVIHHQLTLTILICCIIFEFRNLNLMYKDIHRYPHSYG